MERRVFEVDPARLGRTGNRGTGTGDIAGSYSGDQIGRNEAIRKPFKFNGCLWICTGRASLRNDYRASAYRLVDPTQYDGIPTTYYDKLADDAGKAARADPLGFYDGMVVKSGGREWVLVGPPAEFIAGVVVQPMLFDQKTR